MHNKLHILYFDATKTSMDLHIGMCYPYSMPCNLFLRLSPSKWWSHLG